MNAIFHIQKITNKSTLAGSLNNARPARIKQRMRAVFAYLKRDDGFLRIGGRKTEKLGKVEKQREMPASLPPKGSSNIANRLERWGAIGMAISGAVAIGAAAYDAIFGVASASIDKIPLAVVSRLYGVAIKPVADEAVAIVVATGLVSLLVSFGVTVFGILKSK